MVKTLEAMKGSKGSIKVGTTGTISSLMTRELETIKSAPQTVVLSRNKPRTIPTLVPCAATTPKILQQRKSVDEGSSSGSINNNSGSPEFSQKTKIYSGKSHKVPMLGSPGIFLEQTPRRDKTNKKGSRVVEIVDIGCGNPDRAWASPITNRLKKLGFSKLSETIA